MWEWCADWYAKDYYKSAPSRNPMGPSNGTFRVMRGGGWSIIYAAFYDRCANRIYDYPSTYYDLSGFRLAR